PPNALSTAGDVFNWFYYAKPGEDQQNGLLNDRGFIRELPGAGTDNSPEPNQAWSGDQGWFLRALYQLRGYRTDLGDKINQVLTTIEPAILKNLFVNNVVRELSYSGNFNIDYATGPGVFMRQFAFVYQNKGKPED